ncbi:hypothetical protein M2138_000322 [Dysgonomonadaceae bacterium PH5-43]|nr:hypothetical protein [Dysgonomonadaceae bacterium PH5-43]
MVQQNIKKNSTLKKVGIISYHAVPNYGAVLQTFALYKTLENLGVKPYIINRQATKVYFGKRASFVRYYLLKTLPLSLFRKLNKLVLPKHVSNFYNKYLNSVSKPFFSDESLCKYNFDLDYIIAGCDQIWNFHMAEEHSEHLSFNFFLNFIKKPNIKKLSYAASFGKNYWDNDINEETKYIKDLINKFSHISVRETSGVKLCKEIFNVEACCVLDPTLLLDGDFYSSHLNIDDISYPKDGVVFFKFCQDPKFFESVKVLASNSEENFYIINSEENSEYYYNIQGPSFEEWLSAIKHSKLVVTDSFHGMAFAIIFRRPFVVLNWIPERIIRQLDLMDRLNIKNRFADYDLLINNFNEYLNMDYSTVEDYLKKEQDSSLCFLKKALGTS